MEGRVQTAMSDGFTGDQFIRLSSIWSVLLITLFFTYVRVQLYVQKATSRPTAGVFSLSWLGGPGVMRRRNAVLVVGGGGAGLGRPR